jgi:hypothetical protein
MENKHGDRFTLRRVLEKPAEERFGGVGLLDEATIRADLARIPTPVPGQRLT